MRLSEENIQNFLALVRAGIGHTSVGIGHTAQNLQGISKANCNAPQDGSLQAISAKTQNIQPPKKAVRASSTNGDVNGTTAINVEALFKSIDWKAMAALSYGQGLSAIVLDGAKALEDRMVSEDNDGDEAGLSDGQAIEASTALQEGGRNGASLTNVQDIEGHKNLHEVVKGGFALSNGLPLEELRTSQEDSRAEADLSDGQAKEDRRVSQEGEKAEEGQAPLRPIEENDSLQESGRMPSELAQKWKKLVERSFEANYANYTKRIGQLAWFFNEHQLKLMVLKGYGLSLNYPRPEHRPCGDIDIYAFGKYKEADHLINKELGVRIDNSHHHHTTYTFMGYMVENHYDLINVHSHKSSAKIETILKELALDDSHSTTVNGQKIYLPTPKLNALFLLRHSLSHFASEHINLRQLLDWGFFVKKYSDEIDWKWLQGVLEAYNMNKFFFCINYICINYLGFSEEIFPKLSDELSAKINLPALSKRILADCLEPEFSEKQPSGLIARVLFKYRRWQANSWKHTLCYSEGRLSSFFVSAWSHLLKPKSI